MKPRSDAIKLIGLVVVVLASSQALGAQRTFVASTGSDANPCTFAAPCRSFAAAIAVTDPSGEVIVTDSAGYGAVTITQSVAIIAAPGVYAGLSVFTGQNGITVNAGPSDKVVLRGLTINGQGGNEGIWVLSGGEVHIEDCVIANMGDRGVLIEGGDKIHISDSVIRSNAQGGVNIIGSGSPVVSIVDTLVLENAPTSGFSTFSGVHQTVGNLNLNRVVIKGNGNNGIFIAPTTASSSVEASIVDSEIADNRTVGLWIQSGATDSSVKVDVTRTVAAGNRWGFVTDTNPSNVNIQLGLTEVVVTGSSNDAVLALGATGATNLIRLQRSKLIHNNVGVNVGSITVVESCGDNLVRGNNTDVSGTITAVACGI